MTKYLCLDPAGESFGAATLEVDSGKIYITMHHLLTAPPDWDISKKNSYMSHCVAALVGLEKPDVIISEKPWGLGFSKDSLLQLIGAIKAETWANISWQGVSEMRRGLIGDGYGASDKLTTAEWLLQYPFNITAKRFIQEQMANAAALQDKSGKDGYDILDAIEHGVYYLVERGLIQPVHKPAKEKRKKKKGIINETAS